MTAMVFGGYRCTEPCSLMLSLQVNRSVIKQYIQPLAKAPRLAFAGGIVSLSMPGKLSKCKDILAIISCSIKAPSGA